jgi:hypothetical protein
MQVMALIGSPRPCKARKVKCDEAHPTCLNCQRQNDVCDYSVRLNWDGRGKRKAKATNDRQTIFRVDTLSAGFETPPKETVKIEVSVSPPDENRHDALPSRQGLVGGQISTHTNDYGTRQMSKILGPKFATWEMEPPNIESSKDSATDDTAIDPILRSRDAQQPCASPPFSSFPIFPYKPLNSPYAQPFEQSYERYRDEHSLKSPSESGPESPTGSSVVDFASDKRPSKRIRHGYSSIETNSRFIEMTLPFPSPSRYHPAKNRSPQVAAIYPSQFLTPMTASSQSDDGQKSLSVKRVSHTYHGGSSLEWRRLSVESLLSGPPGMSNTLDTTGSTSREQTPLPYGDPRDDMITWGIDRGLRDLDIGKNDDANAISKEHPNSFGEHSDNSLDVNATRQSLECVFGVQPKVAAFEKGGYYER